VLDVVELVGSCGEGRRSHDLEALPDARLQRHGPAVADYGPMRGLADGGRERRIRVALAGRLHVAGSAGEVALADAREVKATALFEFFLGSGEHAHIDLLPVRYRPQMPGDRAQRLALGELE